MEKEKGNIAIKILIFILLTLLIVLIPNRALAANAPSFWVRSSLSECYDGETTTISIIIYNDTGVHILPTSYYLDGTYYPINTTFMVPKQNMTINKNYTVYFNGAQSVSYDVLLVYHEDGDFDTYTAWQTVTIQKSAMQVITPQPMTIITPIPASTPMGVITPQPTTEPHIDVPTPDLSNMHPITPTPDNGLGNIGVITPAPNNLPQSTPEPAEHSEVDYIQEYQEADEDRLISASNNDDSLAYETSDEQVDNANVSVEKSYNIAGVVQSEVIRNIKNTFYSLDIFTKLCLVVIAALSAGYVFLAIKIKKQNNKG